VRRSPPGRSRPERAEALQLADGAAVPITAPPAPANTRDHVLLPATLDVLTEVGAAAEQTTVHLDADYDYRPSPARPHAA
jgi:hypothetical protein